ncbi:oxidoreductase, FAD-binding protein [Oceaniovalibus guishaninsula JLT2003]|uniref:Oxidoreductase, FAD-binding protein n=1 Tax=Oceaniovalibus guishaninsula JLT2003 TaxID=1231392 RepID=K2GNR0_9RHOB|nr:FAD-binding oxidoreductase [Oceaniovalibus guishaninsula]EKE44301.1 oxidoreductase, FAD-binding protein [Oceaniovalibus guishaninsula JLT2003]
MDVTVRGAGIFGLSIAYLCVRRGARVAVIDPAGPGAGASGGLVGALAPHVPENWNAKKAFQLDSLLAAESFWRDVAGTGGGDPGYVRSGRLQPLADDGSVALARERSASAAALWRGRAVWSVEGAPRGWAPATPIGLVVRDTLSAQLHPRRAIDALVRALAASGVRTEPEGPDRGAVVWATGAQGLADLSAVLGQEVGRAVKGQAALLRHDARGMPHIFADGLHVIAHDDGTVAVGSTTERDFADPAGTDARLDDIVARARLAVPGLAGAGIVARWAGLRPRARSRAPMLGPWPGRPGHYIANGGFKIGFGMAPRVAEAMADLMLDGRDAIPAGFRVTDNLKACEGGHPSA